MGMYSKSGYRPRDFTSFGFEGLVLSVLQRAVQDARAGGHDGRQARRWLEGLTPDPAISYQECVEILGLPDDIHKRWPDE